MKKSEDKQGIVPEYREALEELEKLVEKIEDPSTGVEEIAPMVKRSLELAEICRSELRKYNQEIDKLQNK